MTYGERNRTQSSKLRGAGRSVCLFFSTILIIFIATPSTHAQQISPSLSDPVETAISARRVLELQTRAKTGDPDALYRLGDAYRVGSGVPEDRRRAAGYFRRAADQGHAGAMAALGSLYYFSGSPIADPEAALMWWREAARKEDARAYYLLSLVHYQGEIVEKDLSLAYGWMLKALESDLPEAESGIRQLEEFASEDEREKGASWAFSEIGLPPGLPPSALKSVQDDPPTERSLLAGRYVIYDEARNPKSGSTSGQSAELASSGASSAPPSAAHSATWRPIAGPVYAPVTERPASVALSSVQSEPGGIAPPEYPEVGPAYLPAEHQTARIARTNAENNEKTDLGILLNDDAPLRELADISPGAGAPTLGGWLVQVAALATPGAAEVFMQDLTAQTTPLLSGKMYRLEPVKTETGGSLYRVQIGPFGDQASANLFCLNLKENGGDCFTVEP